MKYLNLFVFTFLLGTGFLGYGQKNIAKNASGNFINVFVKGGANLSEIRTDLLKSGLNQIVQGSMETQQGWVGGLGVRVGRRLFIQPELLVSQKGGSFAGTINIGSVVGSRVFNLNYTSLDMPVLLGIRRKFFYVLAGPVASYSMSENSAISEAVKEYFNDWKGGNGLEKASLGYQAGAGIQFLGLYFDVRYEGSLNNLVNESLIPTGLTIDSRLNLWQATLGFNLL